MACPIEQSRTLRGESVNLRAMDKERILYWADKYDKDHPWWTQKEKELGDRFRQAKSLTKADLDRVVEWKFKELKGRKERVLRFVKKNADITIQQTCSQVFAMSDDSDRMKNLDALHGVGPAVASAILAFYAPKQYGVHDIHVWREFFGKEPSNIFIGSRCYLRLLAELRKIAGEYDLDARTVEKAYFKKNIDETGARGRFCRSP